jgi:hypothetical protein
MIGIPSPVVVVFLRIGGVVGVHVFSTKHKTKFQVYYFYACASVKRACLAVLTT